jgi:hypothetical protein
VPAFRLFELPERSCRETVPVVDGVHVIVTAVPAWIVPPVGEVMAFGDCATASAAKMERKMAKNFMVPDILTEGLIGADAQTGGIVFLQRIAC